MTNVVTPDLNRGDRIGIDEAVLCDSKSVADLIFILEGAIERNDSLLLTRLFETSFGKFPADIKKNIDYDAISATGFLGPLKELRERPLVAIVTAGTSGNSCCWYGWSTFWSCRGLDSGNNNCRSNFGWLRRCAKWGNRIGSGFV